MHPTPPKKPSFPDSPKGRLAVGTITPSGTPRGVPRQSWLRNPVAASHPTAISINHSGYALPLYLGFAALPGHVLHAHSAICKVGTFCCSRQVARTNPPSRPSIPKLIASFHALNALIIQDVSPVASWFFSGHGRYWCKHICKSLRHMQTSEPSGSYCRMSGFVQCRPISDLFPPVFGCILAEQEC